MAVGSTATPDASDEWGSGPIRTCIGCRGRAAATELFRVVVARAPSETDPPRAGSGELVLIVPDPGSSASGRGAWLHPNLDCAQQAQRRRAFARALRVPGMVDSAPVLAYVAREFGLTGEQAERRSSGK